jgi:hypothetical protein
VPFLPDLTCPSVLRCTCTIMYVDGLSPHR